MTLRRMLVLSLAASVLGAPYGAVAQYGSQGTATGTGSSSQSGSSVQTPSSSSQSGSAAQAPKQSSDKSTTMISGAGSFTITSLDKNANTIKVSLSGQDFSHLKQGDQITVILLPTTSGPGRSEQTPSRGNEPYGQAKKGTSATIVSMDQTAKTMTLRLVDADWATLQAGSQLTISMSGQVDQKNRTSSPNPSSGSQGLSGGSGSASPSTTSPSTSPQSSPSSTSPERQSNPSGSR